VPPHQLPSRAACLVNKVGQIREGWYGSGSVSLLSLLLVSVSGGGVGGFGAAPAVVNGTTIPYQPTTLKDPPSDADPSKNKPQTNAASQTDHHYQSISVMPQYERYSAEELRVQDYQAGRKGPTAGASTGFGGFGQPQQPAQTGFGAPAPTGGLFGASSTSTPAFGAAAPATGAFGAPAPAAGGGLFGGAAPASNPFGQPAQPAAGGFGQPAAAAPTAGLFGSAGGAFGQPAQQQPASTGFGGFGAAAKPAGTGFSFGAPPPASAPAPTGGIFGAAAPQASNPFGTPASAAPAAGGLFGAAAQPAQPAAGGFSFGGGKPIRFSFVELLKQVTDVLYSFCRPSSQALVRIHAGDELALWRVDRCQAGLQLWRPCRPSSRRRALWPARRPACHFRVT